MFHMHTVYSRHLHVVFEHFVYHVSFAIGLLTQWSVRVVFPVFSS